MRVFTSLFLLFVLIFTNAHQSAAQSLVRISGNVKDSRGAAVFAATVAALKAADSTLAKAGTTEEDGSFDLLLPSGDYLLNISALGFETYSSPIKLATSNVSLPEIKLMAANVELKEVIVSSRRPMIEVKPDKVVFNVENSISAQGSNVLELLQKSPGVVVDQNNSISLKGRGSVQIQIDGRPAQVSSDDLAELLKSIQASDVSVIDLISNPSAKYDAEGTAGIINIKLKKNKSFGTNGSFTAGYAIATFPKYNSSLNLNHRNQQVNVFGNVSYNTGNRLNNFNIYRIQNDTIYDQKTQSITDRSGTNFKAGADFFLDQKNTLGVMVTGNLAEYDGTTNSYTNIMDQATATLDKVLSANTAANGYANNADLNLNYRFADTAGHELNLDADYGFFRNSRESLQPNVYTSAEGVILDEKTYRTIAPTDIDIVTLKADYTQNFLQGKLGAGFKFSNVRTDNVFDFYNVIDNTDELDTSRSNRFIYTENINAAYFSYEKSSESFNWQLGLRMEQTNSDGNLESFVETDNEEVKRSYLDWFPSGGITYELNKKNSFSLNYSRRIDRPNYQELNPFEYKLDELTYRKGNPFLNPQYTHKVELTHTFNYSLNTSLSYSRTDDFFAQYTDTVDGSSSFITTRNLGTQDIFSFDINAPYDVTDWWSLFFNGNVYYQHYSIDLGDGINPVVELWSYSFYAQNTFKLPKGLSLEVSGWFSGPSIWGGAYRTKAQGSMDLGAAKKLFKDRGTLKLALTDVFYTQPWNSVNEYGNLSINGNGSWESRQLKATFTYRFGNTQVKGARQRSTGNESERNRVSDQQ